MKACLTFALAAAPGLLGGTGSSPAAPQDHTIALKAGTVLLVQSGEALADATVLVRDGRVQAVGVDLALAPDVQVVDYGPYAVIAPGLVAANSSYGLGAASARTADPTVRATDNFDPYSDAWLFDVSGGVTTVYVAPARGRLIAGQGAVIKLGGSGAARVLSESAALHGTITAEARGVAGYWEPPVPATVDVGLGVVQQQLPRTTMGAVLALRELLSVARGGPDDGEYGPTTGAELAELIRAGTPWRMGASSATEVRALLALAAEEKLPLVLDGAEGAGELADELAAAGVSVVVKVDVAPQRPGRDLGQGRDARWPTYDAAAKLIEAGVPTAIATPDNLRARELRFAASVASRGGLDREAALRAITLGAAEVLGVSDAVGSIEVGKEADFVVTSGHPMDAGSGVIATWIDGELAWKAPSGGGSGAVVIAADELHLGDGTVLSPGQVLLVDGRIAEVGSRVGRPMGATVVRGAAAMPGMVDALGHLGLDGSSKTPATDFKLSRIVEPGDFTDRRVARAGVTTVVLAPRGPTKTGAPMMAYKPAGSDSEAMVVEDPVGLRLAWSDPRNRIESGKDLRGLLEKAVQYDRKWREYDEAIAAWVPPPEPAEKAKEEADEDKDEDKGDEKADEKADDKKSKKKKKKDDEEEEGDPLTGAWEGELVVPPSEQASAFKLRLGLSDGSVAGTLRCDALSDRLVIVAGTFEDGALSLSGLGTRGFLRVEGKVKKGELEGKLRLGSNEIELAAERTSKEYRVAELPELRKPEKADAAKAPKGKPKPPGVDEKLEPLRAAMRGEKIALVHVDREDEVLECVDAFEAAGIQPVLYGADDAWRVADEIRGRVAGVLLTQQVLEIDPRGGLDSMRNRYQELASAGIPVAFHSAAEEGAAELWLQAAYAVSQGLSPTIALRAVTSDAASIMGISHRVGLLEVGRDADILLLDGPPMDPSTSVLGAWVNGEEVR